MVNDEGGLPCADARSDSLSLRRRSGEKAGERGNLLRPASVLSASSPQPSPPFRMEEREEVADEFVTALDEDVLFIRYFPFSLLHHPPNSVPSPWFDNCTTPSRADWQCGSSCSAC